MSKTTTTQYQETETVRPGEPLDLKPIEVKVTHGNFDRAFRIFRTVIQKEKVLSIYKEKSSYEKPSDKKRRKLKEAESKRFEMTEKAKKPKVKKEKEEEVR